MESQQYQPEALFDQPSTAPVDAVDNFARLQVTKRDRLQKVVAKEKPSFNVELNNGLTVKAYVS